MLLSIYTNMKFKVLYKNVNWVMDELEQMKKANGLGVVGLNLYTLSSFNPC